MYFILFSQNTQQIPPMHQGANVQSPTAVNTQYYNYTYSKQMAEHSPSMGCDHHTPFLCHDI